MVLDGSGIWPTSRADAHGQTTTYPYGALGRMISQAPPHETSDAPTAAAVRYRVLCIGMMT